MKKIFFVLSFLAALTAFLAADVQGDSVAQKHFGLKKSADTTATATMTLIDKSGSKKIRKLEMYTKDSSEGKNSFINFLSPAEVSGTKFLTLSHRGSDSEQRLYLPALKKTRKISASSKDGEFVGSDLWFYDMEDRNFEDYSYTFLSDGETLSDFPSMKFIKIEMKPKTANAPYSRTVAWINADNFGLYRLECFAKNDDSLLKTITFQKIETIQGILVPTVTKVLNHKKGTQTILELTDIKINNGIKDSYFTVKNLEQ